tara:strand:+ start:836 stop:1750 length:915 start_codon:yes stop_codon:yes gene_type:complete
MRDAIFNKETKTRKGPSGGDLAGPAVNFGYENNDNTNVAADTDDSLYHVVTPEMTLTGLKAVQTPIISRSGELERTGHRITGSCTFYMPSLSYIRALPEFSTTTQFDELETYDKLIDMERIIQNPSDVSSTGDQTIDLSPGSTYPAGYEIDRIQFKIKITSGTLTSITLNGEVGGTGKALTWTATDTFRTQDADTNETFVTIDLPVRDIESGSTRKVQQGGEGRTFTANPVTLDVDKLIGDDSNYLSSLVIDISGSNSIELKDIYLYKEAEWRVETIKDYRDEYMEIGAVRVRGDRTSRRRTYG